ncbi:response regulator receiver domain protein (CheY-like) [Indibacter alkaliphilus LW1]|jgi:two-component system NtrC family sensor kinase|uniref:histidine kinase n=1 Tax=Indibacter alkaliphilus (strain CCUG 57479 / KCTC 22604 / LW1) TaxID=1189612 RepID=S2E396_INDAL|nr:ATP-binding protein [Indibacter alkaliphilus]EOZ96603.1 response regulator receiver domain protein (CheY-like) [Indibacter alkaliphilus LW1]
MGLENIITIVLLYYLHRNAKDAQVSAEWKKYIWFGFIGAILLLILGSSSLIPLWLTSILSLTLVGGVAYLVLNFEEFQKTKPLFFAVIPLIAISVLGDFLESINKSWYNSVETVFDVASFFAFVWAIVMYFTYRKQRKIREAERLVAIEREREFEITQKIKKQLEKDVAERTEALMHQKEELEKTLAELKATQSQLIHAEKMASLGELTAGIAHEIQNPLNFVNNFAEVSTELIEEMEEELAKGDLEEVKAIFEDLKLNMGKINHHGKRADGIVKGMLQHSRNSQSDKELTDINALADEFLRLSYHGLRAKDKSFNANFSTDFEKDLPKVKVVPQDLGRVFLNLVNNAFYACAERKKKEGESSDYKPEVKIGTRTKEKYVEITVSDNGEGIPDHIKEKIFQPFFTTKPTGQGTGLGLSLSYDIIKAHGGDFRVKSNREEGTVFIIRLPFLENS